MITACFTYKNDGGWFDRGSENFSCYCRYGLRELWEGGNLSKKTFARFSYTKLRHPVFEWPIQARKKCLQHFYFPYMDFISGYLNVMDIYKVQNKPVLT